MRYATVLVAVLALACSKKTETPEPVVEPSSTEPKTAAPDAPKPKRPAKPAAAAPQLASVELVSAGEPPRKKLRWRFQKGAKHELNIRTKSTVQADLPSQIIPETPDPSVSYQLAIVIEEVAEDGSTRAAFRIARAESEEGSNAANAQIRDSLAALQGAEGSLSIDSRGAVTNVEMETPASATSTSVRMADGIKRSLHSLTLPIPEQELGKGAQWTVTREIEENGIRVAEITTVDVKSIEEGTVRLGLDIMQSADPQVVSPPGGGTAARYRLGVYSASGRGKAVVKLSQLVPVSYDTQISSMMGASAQGPDGQQQIVSMTTKTRLAMNGK